MVGQQLAQLEEENKHLEFMASIKKYDEDQPNDYKETSTQEQRPDAHAQTLQELGFGPEDEDDLPGGNQFVSQPTPANAMAASASGGYEIPHRLRTLHNLVGLISRFY